jgi:Na+/melibiose symporter-like transporter
MTLSRTALFQYGILALPLAFAGLPLYIHAPDYYSRDLCLDIGLIGTVLLVIRLFDAFQDPAIGYISDRYTNKRNTIVLTGAVMLVVGMGIVFYGPQFNISTLIWFTAGMILATTGFSIVTINLTMLGGFWSDQPEVRTRISGWREAFALTGLLIASVLPAFLQHNYSAEVSFIAVFWFFSILMVICYFFFSRFLNQFYSLSFSNRQNQHPGNQRPGFSFFHILLGQDRRFFLVCFLAQIVAALPAVLVLFFIRDYLAASDLSGLFLFLYFISRASLMAIWIKLAATFGKEKAWMMSMLLSIITFIWAFFLQPGDVVAYGMICVFSGIALGADLALPPSILADRITVQKRQADVTQYYAMLAFIPKVVIALASGAGFLILDSYGFVPGVENTDQAHKGLIILCALIPCLIKLVAVVVLWRLQKSEGEGYENIKNYISDGVSDVS